MLKNREVLIFLFVGSCSVAVDHASYSILSKVGIDLNISKGLGFVIGTIFAYFANKKITFNYSGPQRFFRFSAIYGISLILNISINSVSLALLNQSSTSTNMAFILATLASATFNFLGMKYFTFK
jgi:putative flippase GtrA